jgi:hypothetical protein
MRRVTGHLRGNAISYLALFVALGGTSYAVATLPVHSVGTKQLKKNAVVSSKVKDGSLHLEDFKAGQLPTGPRGLTGPQGLTGANGTNGTNGTNGATNVVVRPGPGSTRPDAGTVTDDASCNAGERATGGGGYDGSGGTLFESRPLPTDATTPTGWRVSSELGAGGHTLTAYVICASP